MIDRANNKFRGGSIEITAFEIEDFLIDKSERLFQLFGARKIVDQSATLGDEFNSLFVGGNGSFNISAVREAVHYLITGYGDDQIEQDLRFLMRTFKFPANEHITHLKNEAQSFRESNPKIVAIEQAIHANSLEAARTILTKAGSPGVIIEGGTLHDLDPQPRKPSGSKKKWWHFWR